MIILLDLNYILVGNSEQKAKPFTDQIDMEQYRKEIVELVKPHYVILVTARPFQYREQTIKSIKEKTDWSPQESYFNDKKLPPAVHKMNLLNTNLAWVCSKNSMGESTIAIDSNPRTIEGYMNKGIFCLTLGKSFVDAKKGFTELTEDVRE